MADLGGAGLQPGWRGGREELVKVDLAGQGVAGTGRAGVQGVLACTHQGILLF